MYVFFCKGITYLGIFKYDIDYGSARSIALIGAERKIHVSSSNSS